MKKQDFLKKRIFETNVFAGQNIGMEIETRLLKNVSNMIHAELPNPKPAAKKTRNNRHISIISPERIIGNDKLLLTLMLGGMVTTFVAWALRSRK